MDKDAITVQDIARAIQDLKPGKSAGIDHLSSEHFKFADKKLLVLLKIVFNCMLIHGHLPKDFMYTLIIPIIKNSRGNVSDSDNYRPIALTNVASKVMEIIILSKYKDFFITECNQFGFKHGHSTDVCVFTLKSVIDYYISMSSPMYLCFIDASKAFDRVEHCKLFAKLSTRKFPKIVLRLLYMWYRTQMFIVKWGSSYSDPFTVINGVRQGGVLSPVLFNVYIDDLSCKLNKLSSGCNINNTSFNHLVYADDTVLLAPSPSALQDLIKCCEDYAKSNDIIYNVKKSFCMCIKPNCFKDISVPMFYLNDRALTFVSEQKYLGYMVTDKATDDADIQRQMKYIYSTGNGLVRNFKHCSEDVKSQLFTTYLCNFYCSHLWSSYKKSTYQKLNVSYNNIFRALFKIDRYASVSCEMLKFDINAFQILIRKYIFNFRKRILNHVNHLVCTLVDSVAFTTNSINREWVDKLFT